MKAWVVTAALALAGCSGQADGPAAQQPTRYHIDKADLYRPTPKDICRFRDAAFLQHLILRVTAALPPGSTGFDFQDFDARKAPGGKGMEAVLRFTSSDADGPAQTMYAAGPFDPATCAVGPMTGGVGSDPHGPDARETFHVAGAKSPA